MSSSLNTEDARSTYPEVLWSPGEPPAAQRKLGFARIATVLCRVWMLLAAGWFAAGVGIAADAPHPPATHEPSAPTTTHAAEHGAGAAAAAAAPAVNLAGKVLAGEPASGSALVGSAAMIASSNLLVQVHPTDHAASAKTYQTRLELAQRERQLKNYAVAVSMLSELLQSRAGAEVKRNAWLELALTAQEQGALPAAQRAFTEFLKHYPDDPSVPEVLLRQGLLYRQMGVSSLALSKFYSVMTSVLALKTDRLETYQRLVLQAQTEIADTYYQDGTNERAIEFFQRLLRQDAPELNRVGIYFKLINSLHRAGNHADVVKAAKSFLDRHPETVEEAEVRFLFATSLKRLGRGNDALREVMVLLREQHLQAKQNPDNWTYWQRRTGQEIANHFFNEGDFVHALDVYLGLLPLDRDIAWQWPVQYQIALAYERLRQPQKVTEYYDAILAREKELPTDASPGLKAVLDMAKWRKNFLQWQAKTEKALGEISAESRVQTIQ